MSDEHSYELVMPFILCRSAGGPHDDDAFTSGWRMAELAGLLERSDRRAEHYFTIRTDEREQADLIAMRYGWTMDEIPFKPEASEFEVAAQSSVDGWLWVVFQGAS